MFPAFVSSALIATAALVAPALHAQTWPAKPVTLVVPYPPGGSADILARTLGQKLGERIGQNVIVENKPGAGTAIGAKAVASSPADGYTLLLGTVSSQAINPAMNKVGYDPVKDFAAVSPVAAIPFVLVAHPSVPVKNVNDVLGMARAQPGKIGYASAGPGTSNHLAGELMASAGKVDLLHVPYKGSAPALNDVLSGHVPLMFDLLATALPNVQSGKLKPLAVTSRERSALLPEVPTARESGLPDYEVTAWFGIFAPAATPAPVVQKLNTELTAILKSPDIQKRLRDMGAEPETGSVQDYGTFVRAEADKWTGVVQKAGLVK
ncbi:Bug family tripartite tricarboxylate transporter substrate binding protein [Ramlibacter rhizophilus]|uniref:Tripartite tricarboxylate transporter substrate binding protein n=1 Tax=Ramlibacter rhizophilus TaxID=1781167 RepID=A0A4Z0C2F1_9BURK|nr:tripartite tricarboxylate transporter substrate binding protein [Ramlibacter rhizophilus]TFZ04688.1 tripartite tricarboxylate transporter substrate binding protein [Ramlibacter rhizophilus]